MPPNTQPRFSLTPNVDGCVLPNANAVVTNDGVSTGTGNSIMYKALTVGANGSFIDSVRVYPVGTTSGGKTATASSFRVFVSTVNQDNASPAATTAANTQLLCEGSIAASGTNSTTAATSYFDIPIQRPVQAGKYILVCQGQGQTANVQLSVMVFAGNY